MQSKLCFTAACLCLFALHLRAQVCFPTITLYNGLSVNIHPADTDGDGTTEQELAIVRMSDFILRADNPCDAGPLTFGMRKSGTGNTMPADTVLAFGCNEIGTQLIEVWVRNASGRTNFSETYVIVQANAPGDCFGAPPALPAACAADAVGPEILSVNGLSAALRPDQTGMPVLHVPVNAFLKTAYDNCDGPYQYRIRKSGWGAGPPNTTSVSFQCWEPGVQLVEVWAGDAYDNWTYSESYVLVNPYDGICDTPPAPIPAGCSPDKTPPDLLACNGLCQGVTWTSAGPQAQVDAKDFIRYGADKCSNFLGSRLTKLTGAPGNKPPYNATSKLKFSCDELGTQQIYLWLHDAAGNWTRTETYVIVQDNLDICGRSADPRAHVVIPEFKKALVAQLGGARTGAQQSAAEAQAFSIWPNPASGRFTLSADLHQAGPVQVELYDCYGRLAQVLAVSQWADAGVFQQQFSAAGLPRGVYRCVLRSAGGVQAAVLMLR